MAPNPVWRQTIARMHDGTRLIHGEVFGGLLVPLFWKRLDARTRPAFEDFNAALRACAEH